MASILVRVAWLNIEVNVFTASVVVTLNSWGGNTRWQLIHCSFLFFLDKKFKFWRQVTKIVNKIFHGRVKRGGKKILHGLEKKNPTDKKVHFSGLRFFCICGGWVVTVSIVQPNDLVLCFLDPILTHDQLFFPTSPLNKLFSHGK